MSDSPDPRAATTAPPAGQEFGRAPAHTRMSAERRFRGTLDWATPLGPVGKNLQE